MTHWTVTDCNNSTGVLIGAYDATNSNGGHNVFISFTGNRVWNSSGSTDMNNGNNYTPTGVLQTTDYISFSNLSVINATATAGTINVAKITTEAVYTGIWNAGAQVFTIGAGGISFNNTTGINLWNAGMALSGNWYYAPGISLVGANNGSLVFYGTATLTCNGSYVGDINISANVTAGSDVYCNSLYTTTGNWSNAGYALNTVEGLQLQSSGTTNLGNAYNQIGTGDITFGSTAGAITETLCKVTLTNAVCNWNIHQVTNIFFSLTLINSTLITNQTGSNASLQFSTNDGSCPFTMTNSTYTIGTFYAYFIFGGGTGNLYNIDSSSIFNGGIGYINFYIETNSTATVGNITFTGGTYGPNFIMNGTNSVLNFIGTFNNSGCLTADAVSEFYFVAGATNSTINFGSSNILAHAVSFGSVATGNQYNLQSSTWNIIGSATFAGLNCAGNTTNQNYVLNFGSCTINTRGFYCTPFAITVPGTATINLSWAAANTNLYSYGCILPNIVWNWSSTAQYIMLGDELNCLSFTLTAGLVYITHNIICSGNISFNGGTVYFGINTQLIMTGNGGTITFGSSVTYTNISFITIAVKNNINIVLQKNITINRIIHNVFMSGMGNTITWNTGSYALTLSAVNAYDIGGNYVTDVAWVSSNPGVYYNIIFPLLTTLYYMTITDCNNTGSNATVQNGNNGGHNNGLTFVTV